MNRRRALSLVFVASAAVLVLEIMAGRMLAPYLGITLESFTGIIGTVLAAISLGAWVGGRAADRIEPGRLLGPLFAGAAVFTLLTPAIVRVVGPSVTAAGPPQIVLAAATGFFPAAFLLSAVPPVIVKMQLHDLGQTGEVVGGFSAVSSAGAIFGTFITGFVLVAAAPSRVVVLAVGILLLGMAAATWRGRLFGAGSVVAVLLAAGAGGTLAAAGSPCDQETAYYCVQVVPDEERPSGLALHLDDLRHSYVDLADPTHLEFRYTKVFADVVASLPAGPIRALHVGGGAFTFPRYLEEVRPGSSNVVLELDPALLELAQRRFGLGDDVALEVLTGDARIRIADAGGPFDVVVGDAFGGRSVPWHLTTVEFLEEVRGQLTSDGVYVMNVIDEPPHRFARAEAATLAEVFPHVAAVAPQHYFVDRDGGNIVLVASDAPIDVAAIESSVAGRRGEENVLTGGALSDWHSGARVLRDDFAPVDQLLGR